jgi:hypothetical protein
MFRDCILYFNRCNLIYEFIHILDLIFYFPNFNLFFMNFCLIIFLTNILYLIILSGDLLRKTETILLLIYYVKFPIIFNRIYFFSINKILRFNRFISIIIFAFFNIKLKNIETNSIF